MAIVDNPSNDGGCVKLYALSKIADFPDFVKTADRNDATGLEEIPSTSFAHRFNRQFPCHTKSACYLSHGYLMLAKEDMPKRDIDMCEHNLQKHAAFWDIEAEVKALVSSLEKKAEAYVPQHSDYALNVDAHGEIKSYFPVHTSEAVYKSAQDLMAHRQKFTYAMRKQAAVNLIAKGKELNISANMLPPELDKMAGLGLAEKRNVVGELENRFYTARNEGHKTAAQKLKKFAALINDTPGEYVSHDLLEKVAEALDIYDRFTGIHQEYGGNVPFPEDVLFGFTKKAMIANRVPTVKLTNGSEYEIKDLIKASAAFSVLGDIKDDLVDIAGNLDMLKVADIVPTLPKDDAAALDAALKTMGISKTKNRVKKSAAENTTVAQKLEGNYADNKVGKRRKALSNRARNAGKFMKTSKPSTKTTKMAHQTWLS